MTEYSDLPQLTDKENKCLFAYLVNGQKKCEAYKSAYECSSMNNNAIYVEASRFFKNPKITLWLEYYQKNQQKTIQNELNYTALDAMKEYQELQEKCNKSSKTYAIAKGIIDSKCKLAGLFDAEKENAINNVTVMGSVLMDGKELKFNVGEDVKNDTPASENS